MIPGQTVKPVELFASADIDGYPPLPCPRSDGILLEDSPSHRTAAKRPVAKRDFVATTVPAGFCDEEQLADRVELAESESRLVLYATVAAVAPRGERDDVRLNDVSGHGIRPRSRSAPKLGLSPKVVAGCEKSSLNRSI